MTRTILKSPPRLIDPNQRIKYGAIQAIVGMAECALSDLRELLESVIEASQDVERDQTIDNRALLLAWSIIDQADLLRHLVESEREKIQISEKVIFLETVRGATEVRNWMRHIPQRIAAYNRKKKPMPPVLGALSFTTVVRATAPFERGDQIDAEECLEYHTVIVANTSMERNAVLEGEPIPYSTFKTPIDHIVLQAFGSMIPLEEIVLAMSRFADAFSAGVARWVDGKLAELEADGHDKASYSQPVLEDGNYRMIAKRD